MLCFIPYTTYFLSTICYMTFILTSSDTESHIMWKILEFLIMILTTAGIVYFCILEGFQIKYKGSNYLKSVWNFIDLLSIILNAFLLVDRFAEMISPEAAVRLAFVAVSLMWLTFIYWLRIFDYTTFYFDLIWQTILDMIPFFLIFTLIIIGCGNATYILNANRVQGDIGDEGDSLYAESFTEGLGFFDAILNQFIVSIGQGDLDNYSKD